MKSLKESLFDNDLVQKDIIYHPKTKDELEYLLKKLIDDRGPNAWLNDIDTSKITDMYGLFYGLNIENIDISEWDVSRVRNMSRMFQGHKSFNSNLSKWDVSKVKDMYYIFDGCIKFNSDLSKWDVGNVQNMSHIFDGCIKFNSDLSKWDVGNVQDMSHMFYNCESFNSNLSKWDVSNVKDMGYMFYDCKLFNSNLSKWNVSKVKDMDHMFYYCESFNSDLSKWNVSKVKDMDHMFYYCESFNSDLSKWDVSNVYDMDRMFENCKSLKKIPSWYWYKEPYIKSLRESILELTESIFDDNVKSNTVIHGETVDPKLWKECERMFNWFRFDVVGDQKKLKTQNVIYNDKDCVLLVDDSDDSIVTIISPETIWFNYIKGSLKKIQVSGELGNNPRPTFYCMSFAKRGGKYYKLEFVTNEFGYTPETISDKAKKIIKKFDAKS